MRTCDSSRLIMVALTSVCFNESGPAVLAFIMVRVQRRIYGFCIGKAVRCFIALPLTWLPSELLAVLVMCTLSSSPLPSHSRHYRKRGIGQIGRDHSGDETVLLSWMDGRCIDKTCRFYTTRLEFTITLPLFMYLISFVFHSVFRFFLGPVSTLITQ